jgi:hypothetical protein
MPSTVSACSRFAERKRPALGAGLSKSLSSSGDYLEGKY